LLKFGEFIANPAFSYLNYYYFTNLSYNFGYFISLASMEKNANTSTVI